MGQIFISYASEDAEFARRLTGELEGEGWTVWWDKQIPPGMDYARVIENAVNAAQCVVVLWSRHSIGSRWVHTEAAAGADRNIVATVIIDDSPNEDIPFEFRRLQAVNLSDWVPGVAHPGYKLLAGRIRSILREPQPAASTRARPSGPVSWSDALTGWGSGRQRGYRGAAVVAGLIGMVACTEGIDRASGAVLAVATGALVLAVALFHLGRRPS